MDYNGWNKSMSHFASIYWYSPLNAQVLLYEVHDSHFDDMALDIICGHNTQSFILKAGGSVHDQPNDNGLNMKLDNF